MGELVPMASAPLMTARGMSGKYHSGSIWSLSSLSNCVKGRPPGGKLFRVMVAGSVKM
jgi:hypothetical protein